MNQNNPGVPVMPPNMHQMQRNPMQSPQMPQMGIPPQQQPQQQQQQQQPMQGHPQAQPVVESITKTRGLVGPLRESLSATLKAASQTLHHNNLTDAGTIKSMDQPPPRFDKLLEDFYSITDQIELHLKTALQCYEQLKYSNHYLPMNVALTRLDPITESNDELSYPQYLNMVKSQINYANEVRDTLDFAGQNIM